MDRQADTRRELLNVPLFSSQLGHVLATICQIV